MSAKSLAFLGLHPYPDPDRRAGLGKALSVRELQCGLDREEEMRNNPEMSNRLAGDRTLPANERKRLEYLRPGSDSAAAAG
jgi:hypothetical protein